MVNARINTPSRVHSGGVVMVITLLAIILIASLLFYVFNVGTSVQSRVVTQHAADSAAIGGASQVARQHEHGRHEQRRDSPADHGGELSRRRAAGGGPVDHR